MSLILMSPLKNYKQEFADQTWLDIRFNESGWVNKGLLPGVTAPRGATLTDTPFGKGFKPSLANQYLQAPYTAETSPQHTQTIEAWFYTEGATPLNTVYSQDRYGANFDKCLASSATAVQVATAGTTINWNPAIPIEMREPLKNGLHHLCVFTRPSPYLVEIFIDGIKIATNTFSISNNGNPVTIGCMSWNNPNSFFNATILRYRQTNGRRYPDNFTPSHPSSWEPV